jgi:hypothetical protein
MIQFGEIFKTLTSSKTYTSVFTDPLKVALLMTAIILLIVYLMFKDEIDEDTSSSGFFSILIKTAVYVAVANLFMVFVFHGSLSGKLADNAKSKGDEDVIKAATAPTMPVFTPVALATTLPIQPAQPVSTPVPTPVVTPQPAPVVTTP